MVIVVRLAISPLLPLTCSTWNTRKAPRFRGGLRGNSLRYLGRHGTRHLVEVRHRGKAQLRYLTDLQFAALSMTSHTGSNGRTVSLPSTGLQEQLRMQQGIRT
jgi:hypothetical protein